MAVVFFDHLIDIQAITAELDVHDLDAEEKAELINLVDEIFHHHILNVVLNHLPEEYHAEFIARLHADPTHPDHLTYLKDHGTVNIEEEITKHTQRVKADLLNEIKRAKTHSPKRK